LAGGKKKGQLCRTAPKRPKLIPDLNDKERTDSQLKKGNKKRRSQSHHSRFVQEKKKSKGKNFAFKKKRGVETAGTKFPEKDSKNGGPSGPKK